MKPVTRHQPLKAEAVHALQDKLSMSASTAWDVAERLSVEELYLAIDLPSESLARLVKQTSKKMS